MSKPTTAARTAPEPTLVWQDGRVVDDAVVPARPWAFLLGIVALVVLVDLALQLVAWLVPAAVHTEVHDRASARAELRATVDDPEHAWLLVGDSVLAGDVMRGRVDHWEQHRVIDELRAAVQPDAKVSFHQIALDALLPVDVLHVVRELDAYDPGGRVPIVVELNPRYFSRSYADLGECTRAWLCELGPELGREGQGATGVARATWAALSSGPWLAGLVHDGLLELLPVARHRRWLDGDGLRAALGAIIGPGSGDVGDELTARARVLAHYQGLRLDSRSQQIRALEQTVARLRANGRRAVFFTTPLEDGFLADAMEPQAYGAYVARMSRLVEDAAAPSVTLVNLDHPLFGSPLFLDHCHLGPEGNRRLAVNLLVELGIGVADVPEREELAHVEGPDATLVARTEVGYSDGAAWQALFQQPDGLAVSPGGARVVIADTGNHVLRELTGARQTVRVIAGAARHAGNLDGPWHAARLDSPRDPVLVGDAVYFIDQKGERLRRLQDGEVTTRQVLQGPKWRELTALVGDGRQLLLLDRGARVLVFDPDAGSTRVLVEAQGDARIEVIAPTGDGRLFLADSTGAIWLLPSLGAGAPASLGATEADGLELVFANDGAAVMPQVKGLYFPLEFDELRFAHVVGMTWVARYGLLLVQDDIPPGKQGGAELTERIHLRAIDLEDRLIYPWLRPIVHGGGYALYNKKSNSFVSYFHEGSMAIDQATATTFWLERGRSRLFHFADGILGVAKIGHIRDLDLWGYRDLLGVASGTETLARLRPDRFLDRRIEPHPRAGPYFGLVIGSSMLAKSDIIGSYSFGVRLETRLREALGYRDGIGLDLVQRSYPGVRSEHVMQHLRSFIDDGAQIDVLFIELGGRRRGFFLEDSSPERMRTILAELDAIARRHDTMVVFFDDSALVGAGRDGLRRGLDEYKRFKAMAADAGFTVVDLSDELMRSALDLSPFGSPPYRSHHAAPWAIDAAADLLGDRVYPALREHLRGRVPAFGRPPVGEDPTIDAVADAFTDVPADWPALLPELGGESVQSMLAGDELQIFVDLSRVEVDTGDPNALADLAAAALHGVVAMDPAGARARRVSVRLATFSRYDEYGAGVRDAADVVFERQLGRAELAEFLREVLARRAR